MKTLLEKLEHEVKTIRADKISEQAFELVDEDGLSKEEIMEAHEEAIDLIENGGDDDDDRQWENGYARGYEVAMQDLIYRLKKENE